MVERGPAAAGGQVLIEVLLVLPVFLFLVFTIMEIGHLAFRTILLHHAAYEAARVGSLTAMSPMMGPACPTHVAPAGIVQTVAAKMLPTSFAVATVDQGRCLTDPQDGCPNCDLLVVVRQRVLMIFPMTGIVLSNTGDRRTRMLEAAVRMPIERPLFK